MKRTLLSLVGVLLAPEGATIQSELGFDMEPRRYSLDELRDALSGWLARLGPW